MRHEYHIVNLMSFRPDGIGTVTVEEKERFEEIKERLRVLLENQITHFRLEAIVSNRPNRIVKDLN